MFDANFLRQYTTREVAEDVAKLILCQIVDGSTIAPYPYIGSMKDYGIDEKDGCCTSRAMIITRRAMMQAASMGENSVRVHVTIKNDSVYVGVLEERHFKVDRKPLGNYVISW